MKRKTVFKVLTLVSTVVLLTACGGKDAAQESTNTAKQKTTQTTTKSKASTEKKKTKPVTEKTTTSSSKETTQKVTEAKASSKTDTTDKPTPGQATKKPATAMDVNAVAKGDFSSVSGTWRNNLGDTLVFDQHGLVSDELLLNHGQLTDKGLLFFSLWPKGAQVGGGALYMVPGNLTSVAGVTFGKDAMTAGQSAGADNNPFYKISDSTEVQPYSNPDQATITVPDGSIAIIRDVPVYTSPDKSTEPAFIYPAGSYVVTDNHFEQDGQYWYSYVANSGTRYYIASADL